MLNRFFDKREILLKAEKLYESGKLLSAFVEGDHLFPFMIKLKRITQRDIQEHFSLILKEAQSFETLPLKVVYKAYEFKSVGVQKLPTEIVFNSQEILLKFINKQHEFDLFVLNYKKITHRYSALKTVIVKKPKLVIENFSLWEKLLSVCDFFVSNPRPNIYIRALAIKEVDTKFIEKNKAVIDTLLSIVLEDSTFDKQIVSLSNYGFERKYFLKYPLPTVRFRILDKQLHLSNLSDISLPIDEFRVLSIVVKNVFIVENKITTLSFPPIENSIVIFGSGYGVKILKDVWWLQDKNIYYWGDIDLDGFAILSQARGYFKQIKSLFMTDEVIEKFSHFSVQADGKRGGKVLVNLTEEEQRIYERLENNFYGKNFRLEQERIPFDYVLRKLNHIF